MILANFERPFSGAVIDQGISNRPIQSEWQYPIPDEPAITESERPFAKPEIETSFPAGNCGMRERAAGQILYFKSRPGPSDSLSGLVLLGVEVMPDA